MVVVWQRIGMMILPAQFVVTGIQKKKGVRVGIFRTDSLVGGVTLRRPSVTIETHQVSHVVDIILRPGGCASVIISINLLIIKTIKNEIESFYSY